jgi:predicted lipoprotein with Yx(FWY)xxD motif
MRLIAPIPVLAAALALAACGAGGGGGGSGAASGTDTVSAKQIAGVGSVLVDRSGMAVYTPDQESGGKILCTNGCTSFWKPVTSKDAMPSAGPGAGKIGTINRPDGTTQVTANGKPLYTFSEDSPGNSKGDGFMDAFDGHQFTWHVVHSGGTTTSSGGAAPASGGSSGGYGY